MAYEYLLTTLPPLPDAPGSPLPISADELWDIVKLEEGDVSEFTEFLLTGLDIQNLEFMERGRDGAARKAVSPIEELKERKNLPFWVAQELTAYGDADRPCRFDRVWEAYYEEFMVFLEDRGAEELQEWFRWEIGLRNAVVAQRAKKLGLPAEGYFVAADLGFKPTEYNAIFAELKEIETAGDPFAEDRFIASATLQRLKTVSPEYAFDFSEIMGYVIKFVILARVAYLMKQGG